MKIKEIEKSATEPVSQTLRLHSIPLEQSQSVYYYLTLSNNLFQESNFLKTKTINFNQEADNPKIIYFNHIKLWLLGKSRDTATCMGVIVHLKDDRILTGHSI